MTPTPGVRTFAVHSATKDEVKLYGVGVYVGDEMPPLEVDAGRLAAGLGWPNPKIVLDSGDVVWGCECWWGPESKLEQFIGGRAVVAISPAAARAEARAAAPAGWNRSGGFAQS